MGLWLMGLCGCATAGARGGAAQTEPPPAPAPAPPPPPVAVPGPDVAPPPPVVAPPAAAPRCPRAPGVVFSERQYQPKLFSRGQDPSADPECRDVVNPERGFFAFRDLLAIGDVEGLRATGISLVYGQALLEHYRDRPLDAAVLARLRLGFRALRAAGLKVLPRFYYAADDKAPDAPIARAIDHIRALTPMLRENADVIAAMHAGFIGAWGEWHPDNRASMPERKRILQALLQALPENRMILVRRPVYKQASFGGPIANTLAFSADPLARLGHLNDCFLASDDDQGTYRLPGEADYARTDSQYVAVGGETCKVNPPRSECASALKELERHHWSFVNRDYHTDVLASWRQGGCYDTIACRLGYRFAVRAHAVASEAQIGGPLAVELSLVNDGYARPFNPRPVYLVLGTPRGPVVLPTGIDARAWGPREDIAACFAVDVPRNVPPGVHRVGLWLPDPARALQSDPRYAIRMVGGVNFDAASGINWLDAMVAVGR